VSPADIAMIESFAAAFDRHARAAEARRKAAETQAESDRARKHAALFAGICAGLLELPDDIAREEATSKGGVKEMSRIRG
jgi:hypothetical protein